VARIAASLGIPVGTVKWRLHAARDELQRALEGERR
jgi:DNA-directed RNA polymerase specialized sigma24 family protein